MSRKYPMSWLKEVILLKKEILEKIKEEKNSILLRDDETEKIVGVKSDKYKHFSVWNSGTRFLNRD